MKGNLSSYIMSIITPIFATPLYKEFWDDRDQLDELRKYIEEDVEFDDGQSKSTDIISEEKFFTLKKFFYRCLTDYLRNIYCTENNLKITQSWVNLSRKGDAHKIHHHPNSVISGVFYVSSEEHSPPIQFYRPDILPYQFDSNSLNEYINDRFSHHPQMGALLLFPSHVLHFVEQNNEETDRVSISFNTTLDGVCGNERSLTLSSLSSDT